MGHLAVAPPNTFSDGFDVFDASVFATQSPYEISSSGDLTDLGLEAMATMEPPWFLWIHYMDPHADYMSHPEFSSDATDHDRYWGEVAFTDHHLGRLFDALELRDDTLVVFNGDHGEMFFEHGLGVHGRVLYDTVLKVPLLIAAPGLEPGTVTEPVGLIDAAPTVLQMLRVPVPDTFEGRALSVVDGAFDPEPAPILLDVRYNGDKRGVLFDGFKLVRDLVDGTELLFDLVSDPGEQADVRAQQPAVAADLATYLDGASPP